MQRQTAAAIAANARAYANLLCIWRLCGNAACRRARRCRGDGVACLNRCLPLTPEPVRDFLDGLEQAQAEGLTWDEALDDLWEEWQAVGDWAGVVAESLAQNARGLSE